MIFDAVLSRLSVSIYLPHKYYEYKYFIANIGMRIVNHDVIFWSMLFHEDRNDLLDCAMRINSSDVV